MHGMVLDEQDVDYTDLKEFGSVTIRRADDGSVEIICEGFDFESADSCRQLSVKSMAWARDTLQAAIDADKLFPGGAIVCVAN